ncbi:recombinase family protein [Flavobacterium gilvum]|uniref:Recombinase family protein n=1 Tax=Flavobacterium gilvum TaxID=1492737 RepID=A0AAC9N418_9FLAO|nr:recombinase family protein [Flavobacterium gilvum]AOW09910.1 hypothetical protein EM308_10540 [Flavobacterium gilvum]KFC58310.1 hypothetical protein FEM08_29140 [Flavobacterium gilvum]
MKRFAIYVRVSTEDQDYQRQISDIKTYIQKDNTIDYEIDIYNEKVSGYKEAKQRPELSKFLDIIKNNPKYYDTLYITELTRLGRNPLHTRQIVEDLIAKKIQICVTTNGHKMLDENREPNKHLILVFQMLMEIGDLEADTLKKRTKSGLFQSARNGNAGGSNYYPYGYRKNESKKLVVDETESEVIKLIYNLYKAGNGVKVIAGILNNKEIPTRTTKISIDENIKPQTDGFKWTDKTILEIIKNPLNMGKRRYKGEKLKDDEVYDGEITKTKEKGVRYKTIYLDAPAIITEQLFLECEEIRLTKTNRNYLTTYNYLLKDLLTCGCCGRNYFGIYKPVENGHKIYICSSRLIKAGSCGNAGINISLLESAIFDSLLSSDDMLRYLKDTSIKEDVPAKIESLEVELSINQKDFNNIESQRKRLLDLYLNDRIKIAMFDASENELTKTELVLSNKINLIKSELFNYNKILDNQNDSDFSKSMLINAKDNRVELREIYNQIISKIVISKVDNKTVLASLFLKLNGVEMATPLNLFLNTRGLKNVPIKYQYSSSYQVGTYQAYDNFLNDENFVMPYTIETGLIDIPKHNLILIEDTYPIVKK